MIDPSIPSTSSEPEVHFRQAAIIDDSGEFLQLAEMMLSYIGIEAIRSYSLGQEALPALIEQPPDILLLDIMMMGVDGITLLAELRAQPSTERLPVILCTAAINRFIEQEERLQRDPHTIVLAKPFSIENLQEAFSQLRMNELRAGGN